MRSMISGLEARQGNILRSRMFLVSSLGSTLLVPWLVAISVLKVAYPLDHTPMKGRH